MNASYCCVLSNMIADRQWLLLSDFCEFCLFYFELKQVEDITKHRGGMESSDTCRVDLSSRCQQSAGALVTVCICISKNRFKETNHVHAVILTVALFSCYALCSLLDVFVMFFSVFYCIVLLFTVR